MHRGRPSAVSVFPAPAGVIPGISSRPTTYAGFPRTCGGDPIDEFDEMTGDEFSPHLRG